MLKRRLLLLRPADLPRPPADSRRLCHPAFPPPVAQRRKGSGYRVNESLPELIPFNQQVHQGLTDAPPKPPGFYAFTQAWIADRAARWPPGIMLAAESALGFHPWRALSSAQVAPE